MSLLWDSLSVSDKEEEREEDDSYEEEKYSKKKTGRKSVSERRRTLRSSTSTSSSSSLHTQNKQKAVPVAKERAELPMKEPTTTPPVSLHRRVVQPNRDLEPDEVETTR
jgi:hypothetical protein